MNEKIKYQRLTNHPNQFKPEDAIFTKLQNKTKKPETVWCMRSDKEEKYLFVATGYHLPKFEKSLKMLYVLKFDKTIIKPKPCFKLFAHYELK